MKEFTEQDVMTGGMFPTIYTTEFRKELVRSEPCWMKAGLQETATGYGGRLNSGWKISFCGKLYRIYSTCYSNCASCWFTVKGRKIYVN